MEKELLLDRCSKLIYQKCSPAPYFVLQILKIMVCKTQKYAHALLRESYTILIS